MKNRLGPRAQAFALMLLVATLGAMIGIGVDRALAGTAPEAMAQDSEDRAREPRARGAARPGGAAFGRPGAMGGRFLDQLEEDLGLSVEQKAAIEHILQEDQARVRELMREYQPRLRAIARETRERIADVLTEEQRELRRERIGGRGRPAASAGTAPRHGDMP